MALNSNIEWTESSWNPVTGCSKISLGCQNCYAERMARRLQAAGNKNYKNGFRVTMHDSHLEIPLRWKKPRKIFVNSMSDLFHPDVPIEFILRVFDVMARAHWHKFQILTKRSERLLELNECLPWKPNIWVGVSVENSEYCFRINQLRRIHGGIKFLSLEPLLGPLTDIDLTGIDWVIVGGESGYHARPMRESWVIHIKNECKKAGIAFFFKQWGGINRKKSGRMLQGRIWDEIPQNQGFRFP